MHTGVSLTGPLFGLVLRAALLHAPRHFFCSCARSCCQALALWSWSNWLAPEHITCESGDPCAAERVLRINVDETSIPLYGGDRKGNICRERGAKIRKVTRCQKRLCFTYIALVCDNERWQNVLPQFVLSTERAVKKQEVPKVVAALPANVRLIRRKSAWADSQICMDILCDIRAVLDGCGCNDKILLYWDCARPHLAPRVFAKARALRINPITVPPGTTAMLQPLDTHIFGPFKKTLADVVEGSSVQDGRDTLKPTCFLECVGIAINNVIVKRNWERAFVANGLRGEQNQLSERISSLLSSHVSVARARPSLIDLRSCFPRRFKLTEHIAYGAAAKKIVAVRARPARFRLLGEELGRTRSETLRMRSNGKAD